MLNKLDSFLSKITMYRLVLWSLFIISIYGIICSLLGWISFSTWQMLITLFAFVGFCYLSNWLFAVLFKTSRNVESALITALILFLIYMPISGWQDLWPVFLASSTAMLSKFILVYHKKHIFNPAAIGSLFAIFFAGGIATWWVSSLYLLPIVLICGLLVLRKIRKFTMFLTFASAFLLTLMIFGTLDGMSVSDILVQAFTSWPLIFLGCFMLTEPMTTPPSQKLQFFYALIVGLLAGSRFQIGPIYSMPELALIIGNIFSFLVSAKSKITLEFLSSKLLAKDIYELEFLSSVPFAFKAGQFLEWTLEHPKADSRGFRRYFTIASAPTEEVVKLGVRYNPEASSSFKKALFNLKKGQKLDVSQLGGDFVLPNQINQKMVFIAGGIGVTPFRSMVKDLSDRKLKADIKFFYAASDLDGFAYQDLFNNLVPEIGGEMIYVCTNYEISGKIWDGEKGYLTAEIIQKYVSDFSERTFYLSGPVNMVNSYVKTILAMGVARTRIKTDYFPGL